MLYPSLCHQEGMGLIPSLAVRSEFQAHAYLLGLLVSVLVKGV